MEGHYNTLVVLSGTALLGAGAGMVGSFSLLRGRALLGDVLAHASLPGLCLAFLILQRRSLTPMLFGALAGGLISVALIAFLRRTTRIKDDAALGVVRSVLFGFGIVLISIVQNRVVEGSKAGLDSYIFGKTAGMLAADALLIAATSAVACLTIVLLYKELRLAAFDPDFARVQGWPAVLLDGLQMVLVAVMTVVGLPAVGAVLVAALLILPGATMRFWTERLGVLLVGSALVGAATGTVGTLVSARFSLMPAGPIIILSGTTFFIVSMLVAPRRGITARMAADARFRRTWQLRKLLQRLYERDEAADAAHRPSGRACTAGIDRRTTAHAAAAGWLEPYAAAATDDAELRLTESGRRRAAQWVRAQRLQAAFLEAYPEQTAVPHELDPQHAALSIPAEVRRRLEERLQARSRPREPPPAADEPEGPA